MTTYFEVPDVEYLEDTDRYRSLIIDAGGKILDIRWSGYDGDSAYIIFECRDQQHKKEILKKCEEL